MSEGENTAPEISLEVISGSLDGLRYVGGRKEVYIGRSPGGRGKPPNQLILARDSYSSSSHAKVFYDGGQWFLEDLGSTNFSKIRGKTLKGGVPPEALEKEECFVVGNTVIEFRAEPRRLPPAMPGEAPVPSIAAKKMIERARVSATKVNSTHVGVEHLFQALAESDAPIVPEFFASAKLNAQDVARQVLEYDRWTGKLAWIGKGALYSVGGTAGVNPKDLWETPRLQYLWTLAEKARTATNASSIEPMHLLIAIMQESGSLPAQVLREMGQNCETLATMALRLATAHFAPEEPETGTKMIAPPKPAAPPRKIVDHNVWVQARELTDSLAATQVQLQLADPATRFEALRGKIREAMMKMPPQKREALYEQLRIMFPVTEGTAVIAPPTAAPQENSGTFEQTPPKNGDDDRQIPSGNGEAATNEQSILKEIFDTANLNKTLGISPDQANSDFLRLTKLFYQFALNMEQLTQSVLQTLGGSGGGESRYFLPFAFQDLKMMIQKLLRDNDSKAVEEIDNYLADLSHWQIALITSFEKASKEWNDKIWDTISPAAIRNEAKVSPAMLKIGGGKADLLQAYEKKVRDLHPEVTGDQFHQLVNALTTQEFKKLSRKDRKSE